MLIDVQNSIINRLEDIKDAAGKRTFRTVDVWNDQPEEMLKKTINLPAAMVALGDGIFKPGRAAIGTGKYDVNLGWDVYVLFENLKSTTSATAQGLGYIDAVITQLSDTLIGNTRLVPVTFALITTIGGKSAYGINFNLEERMGKP